MTSITAISICFLLLLFLEIILLLSCFIRSFSLTTYPFRAIRDLVLIFAGQQRATAIFYQVPNYSYIVESQQRYCKKH